ncbi:MAG: molybdopterin-binding protein [Cyanobacteria bacterium P01_F01_bin.53]
MASLLLFATPNPDQKSVSVACAVLTVSDTLTSATDQKRPAHAKSAGRAAEYRVSHCQILKDDPTRITALVNSLAAREDIQTILLNGGIGIALRDTMYDAIPLASHERTARFWRNLSSA